MKNNMFNLLEVMRELVSIMQRKEVAQEFKKLSSLDQATTNEELVIYLMEQYLQLDWAQRNLLIKAMKNKPETLNVVFGEVAQSYEKSIFANTPKVNNSNSFLNSRHMRILNPAHKNEESIPDRLCGEFNTLVVDIYLIPIPTTILMAIKSEMQKSGLTERILKIQIDNLNEIIRILDPSTVRFICRYKSLLPDSAIIVDRILRTSNVSLEFNPNEALSGFRGIMDIHKWAMFIQAKPHLN